LKESSEEAEQRSGTTELQTDRTAAEKARDTLLYPPSERSETGGYAVFTFMCLYVCEHSVYK